MSKLNLTAISNISGNPASAETTLNTALSAIEAAFDNTLSRDGTVPNSMSATLDLNSNRIINLGAPQSSTDAARFVDVTNAVSISTTLPAQTGNSGKYISTDGTNLAWAYPPIRVGQTPEELAQSITPLDYSYLPGDIRRYGAVRNSTVTADMTATTLAWFNAIKTGHDVYIPPGTWNVNSTTTITGVGEGWSRTVRGADKAGAILKANGTGVTILKVESDLPILKFSDFSMQGATGTGHGVWCTLTCFQSEFRNMWIKMGGKAIYMPNLGGTYGASFSNDFWNVDFSSFDDHGIEVAGGPATNFWGCYAHDFPSGKAGWRVYSGARFFGCNGVDTADYWAIVGQTTAGGLDATNTTYAVYCYGCNFENYGVMAMDGRYVGENIFHDCSFVPKGTGSYTTSVNSDQFKHCLFDHCVWVPLNGASGAGADWQANTRYIVGAKVENNNHQLVCVTAGVSGGSFSSGTGAGQTDGTCVWDYSSVGVLRTAAAEVTCDINTANVEFRNSESWMGTQPQWSAGGLVRNAGSHYIGQIAYLNDGPNLYNLQVNNVLKTVQHVETRLPITYSASMTPDAGIANSFFIAATNTSAFTINAPLNGIEGQKINITISNTSGGVLGAVTWNASFKMASWTSPANGFNRSIQFDYNGGQWVEISRTAADVPN